MTEVVEIIYANLATYWLYAFIKTFTVLLVLKRNKSIIFICVFDTYHVSGKVQMKFNPNVK